MPASGPACKGLIHSDIRAVSDNNPYDARLTNRFLALSGPGQVPLAFGGQFGVAHQVMIDAASGLASLADRPDYK